MRLAMLREGVGCSLRTFESTAKQSNPQLIAKMLEKKAMFAFFRNLKACEINKNSFKANNEDNTELIMAHQSLKCPVLCVQEQVCGDVSKCTEGFPLK